MEEMNHPKFQFMAYPHSRTIATKEIMFDGQSRVYQSTKIREMEEKMILSPRFFAK